MIKLLNFFTKITTISFLLLYLFKPIHALGAIIVKDDFDTGKWSSAWTECANCGVTLTVVSGISRSGNYSVKLRYRYDEEGATLSKYGISFNELYVRFWQMYPTGFTQRNLKQSSIFNSSGGNSQGTLLHSFWGPEPTMQTTFYIEDKAEWKGFSAPAGQWFQTAYYIKYNTPGTANGIYRLWRNGVLLVERTNVIYRTTNSAADGVWVGGNYSGAGVNPTAFDRYIDDVCIANTPTDCGDGNLIQPNIPTNLQ